MLPHQSYVLFEQFEGDITRPDRAQLSLMARVSLSEAAPRIRENSRQIIVEISRHLEHRVRRSGREHEMCTAWSILLADSAQFFHGMDGVPSNPSELEQWFDWARMQA